MSHSNKKLIAGLGMPLNVGVTWMLKERVPKAREIVGKDQSISGILLEGVL